VLIGSRVGRVAAAAVAVVAVSVALVGCGSSSGGSSNTDTGGSPDESAVLRIGGTFFSNAGAFFDPGNYNANSQAQTWIDLMYDTMIHDTADGPKPGLATEWSAPDPQTIKLTLRTGVKFQDGTPFNAEAVKFSWERFRDNSKNVKAAELEALQSVDAVDDSHVVVHLSAPVAGAYLSRFLRESQSGLGVVSPTAARSEGADFEKHPVGAGPYQFKGYVTDQQISLTKFDGYWNADKYHFAGIDVVNVAAGAPTLTALAAGSIDTAVVGASSVESVKAQSGLSVFSEPSDTLLQLGFCETKGPFDNVKARQAVAMGVDRKAINAAAYKGLGQENTMPLATNSPDYDADLAGVLAYDKDKAKSLLQSAGATGKKVTLLYFQQPEVETAATIMQSQLKDLGLDVELRPTSSPAKDPAALKPDMFLLPLRPPVQSSTWSPTGVTNGCQNPTTNVLDAYVNANDPSLSADEHAEAAKTFQKLVTDEVPAAFYVAVPSIQASTNRLKGIKHIKQSAAQNLVLEDVYLTNK